MSIYDDDMKKIVRKQKIDQLKHDAWVAQVNSTYANDPINIIKASAGTTIRRIVNKFKKK